MKYFAIALTLTCGVLTAPIEEEAVREFLTGNRVLTANIYRELTKQNAGNLLVSPISVETVLSLAYEGARGQTAEELVVGLSLPNSNQKIQWAYRNLLPKLQSSTDSLTLSSANRVYLGQDDTIEDNFRSVAVQVYGAGAENVDFSQSQEAADEINTWVEEQTNGRVQNLVDPSNIDKDTRLILVNTLYLSAEWRSPFNSYQRIRGDFYINRDQYVKVEVMRQQQVLNYLQNNRLNAQFLELPLKGNNISMVIVLPNDIDGLPDLEENIAEVLQPQQYKKELVIVDLPRFSVQSSIEFVPVLENLGIRKIFGEGANLSGISSNYQDLYISNVLQKTYINVTEAGVEAAAGTQGIKSTNVIQPSAMFRANRPFLYYIQKNGVILFSGRYVEPEE